MKFDIDKFNIPPTITLARRNTDISDDRAALRIASAYHEAAHLVAAVACRGQFFGVNILPMRGNHTSHTASRGRVATLGEVRVEVESDWHNSVVDLVGRAIQEKLGGDDSVWQDDHRCATARPRYDEAFREAVRFTNEFFGLVEFTATAFLHLARAADGEIPPKHLKALLDYLRPKVADRVWELA